MSRLETVNWLRVLLAVIDVCLLNAGVFVAYWLRFEGHIPGADVGCFYSDAGFILPAGVAIFYVFGLYNRIWQYASSEAVVSIVGAVTATTVMVGTLLWASNSPCFRPTTLAMMWLVWLVIIGGSRFAWRVLREYQHHGRAGEGAQPLKRVLVYGAGEAGATLARRIEHEQQPKAEVVGFIDDDSRKRHMIVRRARVLGSGADLPRLVARHAIDEVMIAIPSASGELLRGIVERCREARVSHSILPSRLQTMDAPVSLSQLRQVEVTDLLSRDPAHFPVDSCGQYLRGKSILVTGAGGSIGAEICRQAVRFGPRKLVLLGRGENRIHEIYQELRHHAPELQLVPAIANFATPGVAEAAFRQHRPDVIFHAGAHKHVYLMEANVVEAVRNNVLGTQLVLEAARIAGAQQVVIISTDKAVEPTSVMGATKRVCEILGSCMATNGSGMHVTTVRFGNVLGTNGSVLRIFEAQLRAGRPLTITHPEATRYFMSCEEAALLVIDAAGQNHDGGVFILDMGEPVPIRQLAGEFVRLSGGDPEDSANYEYIGLCPGEKLHEELANPWEELARVSSYLFRVTGQTCPPDTDVAAMLAELEAGVADGDDEALRRTLFRQLAALSPADGAEPALARTRLTTQRP